MADLDLFLSRARAIQWAAFVLAAGAQVAPAQWPWPYVGYWAVQHDTLRGLCPPRVLVAHLTPFLDHRHAF